MCCRVISEFCKVNGDAESILRDAGSNCPKTMGILFLGP